MVCGSYNINLDDMINSIPEGDERDKACQWLVDVLDIHPEIAWSSNKIISELQSFFKAPLFKGWDPQQVISSNFNRNKWLSLGASPSEIDTAVKVVLSLHSNGKWATLAEEPTYDQIVSAVGSYELRPVGDGVTWNVLTKDGGLLLNHRVILSNGKYRFQVNKEE